MWFVEERCFSGEYRPAVYVGGLPHQKTADRKSKKWLNEPVQIPPALHGQDLRIISAFMSQAGEFNTIPRDDIPTILEQIR